MVATPEATQNLSKGAFLSVTVLAKDRFCSVTMSGPSYCVKIPQFCHNA